VDCADGRLHKPRLPGGAWSPAWLTGDRFEGRKRPLKASDESYLLGRCDRQFALLHGHQKAAEGVSRFRDGLPGRKALASGHVVIMNRPRVLVVDYPGKHRSTLCRWRGKLGECRVVGWSKGQRV